MLGSRARLCAGQWPHPREYRLNPLAQGAGEQAFTPTLHPSCSRLKAFLPGCVNPNPERMPRLPEVETVRRGLERQLQQRLRDRQGQVLRATRQIAAARKMSISSVPGLIVAWVGTWSTPRQIPRPS